MPQPPIRADAGVESTAALLCVLSGSAVSPSPSPVQATQHIQQPVRQFVHRTAGPDRNRDFRAIIADDGTVYVGGEDGYILIPVFKGEATSGRDTLISHSIGGSFASASAVAV